MIYHITLAETGYWEVWADGRVVEVFHTREQAEDFVCGMK